MWEFEYLIYEMLFIQEGRPKLSAQSDSVKAELCGTLIDTLCIPRCGVFDRMRQDFHMHSWCMEDSWESDF